ncbi:Uncharacterised protein [Bordetella pertussis]|nr:Uncharacterised protein [Bordetella pertussis]
MSVEISLPARRADTAAQSARLKSMPWDRPRGSGNIPIPPSRAIAMNQPSSLAADLRGAWHAQAQSHPLITLGLAASGATRCWAARRASPPRRWAR